MRPMLALDEVGDFDTLMQNSAVERRGDAADAKVENEALDVQAGPIRQLELARRVPVLGYKKGVRPSRMAP